jgi:hypothetical protein
MACNKCGHTKSSPCSCQDHGLTTPCSFTNCTTNSCEEVYCYECVVDCFKWPNRKNKKVWTAESATGTTSDITNELVVKNGDSVKEILQRIALYVSDPGGYVNSTELAVAPVFIDNLASTSLRVNWNNIPSAVLQVAIYQANAASTTWTLLTQIVTNVQTTFSYDIINLNVDTSYKFKIITTGTLSDGTLNANANSVVVYATTLT